MIDAVNDDVVLRVPDSENDTMREVNEMADFERKEPLLRDQRTTFRMVLKRVNRMHKPPEPLLRSLGFFPFITNETDVFFCVKERWFRDFNLEFQASPAIPGMPALPV